MHCKSSLRARIVQSFRLQARLVFCYTIWMPFDAGHQRATVDENGDILIPGVRSLREETFDEPEETVVCFKPSPRADAFAEEGVQEEEEDDSAALPIAHDMILDEWHAVERDWSASEANAFLSSVRRAESSAPVRPQGARFNAVQDAASGIAATIVPGLAEMREKVQAVAADVLKEGARQYQSSFDTGRENGKRVASGSRNALHRTWRFLAQPVWVPGRRNVPKKRSRGMLFVTDVVRFGGTFAGLFSALFLTLNYQSFWAILQERLDPLSQTQAQTLVNRELADTLGQKLQNIPALATAGGSEADLLAFLPPVGPPESRLIIPKLDLNVPIVIPPNDALMAEDWKKLEEDIQEALEDGVVHYPGTARPGQAGNFFLTGHSSYFPWAEGDYKSVFARLHSLNVGDEYWVFYGGDRHRYVVTEKKEVKPSDVTVLDQPLTKRISTLMTCTPLGTTLRRLIIVSQELDVTTGEPLEVGEHEKRQEAPRHKLEMLPI